MHSSRLGFLCLNCGKVVSDEGKPKAATITAPVAANTSSPLPPAPPPPPPPPPPPALPSTPVPPSPVFTVDKSQASVSAGMSLGDHFDTSPLPVPGKQSSLKRNLFIALAVLVTLTLAGGGAYASLFEPTHAPTAYMLKLINSKRGQFASTINFTSDNKSYSDYAFKLKTNGQYDTQDLKNPKLDLNVEGSVGAGSLSGELRTLNKMLYVKIGSFSLLSSFGVAISKDWYKADLGDSITRDKCQDTTKNSRSFMGIQMPGDFPVKQAKRIGLWETIDGHRTTHFQGILDLNKLQAFVDKANKKLSADCKIDFNSQDYKTIQVSYDLWASSAFDRLTVRIDDSKSKSHVVSTVDTQKYNQPVNITAPANAKPIESLYGDFLGAAGSDSAPSSTNTSARTRDAQRKADLRNVKTALETYFNDNNYYPSGNYTGLAKVLVPSYIKTLPSDLSAGQAYVYTPGNCKAGQCQTYTLSAKLENASDPSAVGGSYVVTSVNSL